MYGRRCDGASDDTNENVMNSNCEISTRYDYSSRCTPRYAMIRHEHDRLGLDVVELFSEQDAQLFAEGLGLCDVLLVLGGVLDLFLCVG